MSDGEMGPGPCSDSDDAYVLPPLPVPAMRPPADARLSDRELQTVCYLACGMKNDEIAQVFGISTKTVDTHRGKAIRKIGARNNADLTRWTITYGVVDCHGRINRHSRAIAS